MKGSIVKNTATNYLTMLVRLAQGILVTRWTVNYLGPEYYGLWSLLWSFFAYALLLDFGFGVSAQKYTSEEIFKTDISRYNKIISAVFSFHLAMLFLIALGTIGASFILDDIICVYEPEKLAYCHKAFLIFGLGTALAFPLGMFSEILVGLQKFYLRNYVNISFKIFELVGTLAIFLCGGGLLSLVVFTVSSAFASSLIIAFLTKRQIRGFKIVFHIELKIFREICSFSGFAYLMSIANLVLNKSNRILISIFCGLPSVGAYHLSSRLSEYCYMGAIQYQENIRPITANLHARGEIAKLAAVIFNSMRWNTFISLLIMVPTFIYCRDLIVVLFNMDNDEIVHMARIFIFSIFLSTAFRKIPEGYLQMSGHHKLIGYVSVFEAAANVIFNIALLPHFGVVVVLWNSIAIRLVATGIFMVPKMMLSLKIGMAAYFVRVYLVPCLLGAIACLPAWGLESLRPQLGTFWTMVFGGAACAATFALLAYLFMLSNVEKTVAREKIAEIRTKFAR